MNRIKLLESAIKDLHEVKMKHVEATVSEQIIDVVLFAGTGIAIIIGILVATPFF